MRGPAPPAEGVAMAPSPEGRVGLPASKSDFLRAAGDLAEAINRHCDGCSTCRTEWFVAENVEPFCGEGRRLWAKFRETRRSALTAVGAEVRR